MILPLLGLLVPASTAAQGEPVVDLVLEVVKEPVGLTPSGSTGTLVFTVSNEGPDPAGTIPPDIVGPISVLSDEQVVSPEYGVPIEFFFISGDPGCGPLVTIFGEPEPGDYRLEICYLLSVKRLLPGESISCVVGYRINANDIQTINHGWTVGSPNDSEIDPANNGAIVIYNLGLGPTDIPTLSPASLALLALGLATAFAALRRRHQRDP